MPKSYGQKLKLLYLMKFLLERTDGNHGLSAPELIRLLEEKGISAERKSVYDDLRALASFGVDIVKDRDGYRVASRLFELPELKLLVDAVQSSKFVTAKKSGELIAKLETLASREEAKQLHRQVYVGNRVKTMNESIYYNVDKIHDAINGNSQITFFYFEYSAKKEKQYRHNKLRYRVSPYALCWSDENYYMIAYDGQASKLKHYRVDKMDEIQVERDPREGKELYQSFDTALYTKGVFGMFGGEEETVVLRFENRMAGIVLDRFGKEITLRPDGEQHFQIRIPVRVSPQFMAWVFGLGSGAEILSPESVKQRYRAMLKEALDAGKA